MILAEPLTTELVHADEKKLLRTIRRWTLLFIVLLILSGITAFPVQTELELMKAVDQFFPQTLYEWSVRVRDAVNDTYSKYPFLFYGYDWLAYSHIVIALFFTGVYRNPVRNEWVLRIGMLACAGVFVLAFACGQVRGIPLFWTLIDCSFGLFGMIPLLIVQRLTRKLAAATKTWKQVC